MHRVPLCTICSAAARFALSSPCTMAYFNTLQNFNSSPHRPIRAKRKSTNEAGLNANIKNKFLADSADRLCAFDGESVANWVR